MRTSRIQAWYQNPKKHLILAQFSNSPWTSLELFKVSNKDALLDRTLDYLRDHVIQAVKNLFKLDKYTTVNNLLWFAAIKDQETGPEEVIKSYGSISIEHDHRDFLAENVFLVE